VKRGEALLADVTTSFKNKNITADVKVDTKSNVSILFCTGSAVGLLHLYLLLLLKDCKY
jgi:hypothetical protein